jgi:GT2 family glycosyltransferase
MAGSQAGDPVVSVIIISVGRPRLYELLPELEAQETAFPYEVLLIANGPVEMSRIDSGAVRTHCEPPGQGIPYYRNRGTGLARGSIIVYIDDDETTRDASWLARLVEPILDGSEKVTVAGAFIPQGQGFLADLISLLGYPGGGSLGWRNVWNVDENGHTDKLCTCNCAIEKSLLEDVGGFEESLVYGASDLYLGEALLERGVPILFVDQAEVVHEARGDMRGFVRWQVNRGRSIYDLRKLRPIGQFERGHVSGRLKRTTLILRRTFPTRQFLPMIGVLFCEYFFHAVGYALEMIEDRSAGRRLN